MEDLLEFYTASEQGNEEAFEDLISCLGEMNLKFPFKVSIATILCIVFKQEISPSKTKLLFDKSSSVLTKNMKLKFETIICKDIPPRRASLLPTGRLDFPLIRRA